MDRRVPISVSASSRAMEWEGVSQGCVNLHVYLFYVGMYLCIFVSLSQPIYTTYIPCTDPM